MTEDFFKFIMETTKENFSKSQRDVFSNNEYNPYSEDLNYLEELLDEEKFQDAVEYNTVNILLSPRAHLYKNYALTQLKKEDGAKAEMIIALKILECISLTGIGTKDEPYVITRISDEKDFLNYLEEEFSSQSLVSEITNILI